VKLRKTINFGGKLSFHPVFPLSSAPPLLLHIYFFTAPNCTTTKS
jgi:hypothetical protein